MPQIAIVFGTEISEYNRYDEYSYTKVLATSITDWSTVSDEEYQLLCNGQTEDGVKRYMIVVRPDNETEFIAATVQQVLVRLECERKATQERERAAAIEAEVRAEKRRAGAHQRKLKQLEKLKQELGVDS